ncbi:MAG: threonine synthase [Fimbriimonadaceae bacterium]|nr:threonine synthase [Fimbriimonadaceae bacterium]
MQDPTARRQAITAGAPPRERLSAWFGCPQPGCAAERYPLGEVVYRCRRCGGLLEVQHDLAPLRETPAAVWQQLFEKRYGSTVWPYGSGVWGKREWVNPAVDDANVVSCFEGGTNLFWAERFGRELGVSDLWIKQCGNTHTGSFKDLGMTVLVSQVKQMLADGQPIRAIACASTGDTSAALAAYGAAAGIPTVVFLPHHKVSLAQLIQPVANGARVLALDTDFDGCMRIVQEVTADGTIYLANSLNSLRIEGQKTISVEICQQFDWEVPDWIVIPGGNLGNVSALGRGFDLLLELGLVDRRPRICVAQAARANPLYEAYRTGYREFRPQEAQATAASAIRIGNPVSYDRAVRTLQAYDGVVEQASEQELADAAAWADRAGTFNDPHTGVALAALVKLVRAGTVRPHERVVVISTAHGLKFAEWKVAYHERALAEFEPQHANPPLALPNDVTAVRRALDDLL